VSLNPAARQDRQSAALPSLERPRPSAGSFFVPPTLLGKGLAKRIQRSFNSQEPGSRIRSRSAAYEIISANTPAKCWRILTDLWKVFFRPVKAFLSTPAKYWRTFELPTRSEARCAQQGIVYRDRLAHLLPAPDVTFAPLRTVKPYTTPSVLPTRPAPRLHHANHAKPKPRARSRDGPMHGAGLAAGWPMTQRHRRQRRWRSGTAGAVRAPPPLVSRVGPGNPRPPHPV
jgi:hypothetical protein